MAVAVAAIASIEAAASLVDGSRSTEPAFARLRPIGGCRERIVSRVSEERETDRQSTDDSVIMQARVELVS